MKPFKILFLSLAIGIYFKCPANITKQDWVGTFEMNHDGWKGTLVIEQINVNCTSPAWCDLEAYYINSEEKKLKVALVSFSDDMQCLLFKIYFSEIPQKFTGYLFSHDKFFIAGTTIWQNRKFGFYAQKKLPPAMVEVIADSGKVEGSSYKTINDQGNIEIHFPDGRIATLMFIQVPGLVPPLPNDPQVVDWVDQLNESVHGIVTELLNKDEESIKNYENYLSQFSGFERINKGIQFINLLM